MAGLMVVEELTQALDGCALEACLHCGMSSARANLLAARALEELDRGASSESTRDVVVGAAWLFGGPATLLAVTSNLIAQHASERCEPSSERAERLGTLRVLLGTAKI